MTTNGILLKQFAGDLSKAGLHRVNISLDTINPEKYRQITRGGELEQVFSGIHAAKEAGISPIRINCVVKIHQKNLMRWKSGTLQAKWP